MKKTAIAELITQKIYILRDQKVMLSGDLAQLYNVPPRTLIQAVKRNIERFPSDFMFHLNYQELNNLKSQFVISSWGGARSTPYAFTEQGIAMLSSVLHSPLAIRTNIAIIRTFVLLRKYSLSYQEISEKLNQLEQKYDHQFNLVFDAIRDLITPPEQIQKRKIGSKQD